jgi:hypothetical protein
MRSAPVPAFRLQFPSARFAAGRIGTYADESEVEAISEAARRAGFYRRNQVLRVSQWKTEPSNSRQDRNTAAWIRQSA